MGAKLRLRLRVRLGLRARRSAITPTTRTRRNGISAPVTKRIHVRLGVEEAQDPGCSARAARQRRHNTRQALVVDVDLVPVELPEGGPLGRGLGRGLGLGLGFTVTR